MSVAFPGSGRISDAILNMIRDRVTLFELIGQHVKLKRSHLREHVGCCPFHQDKTSSFTVNDSKGFFHCFGCGAHGDAIAFTRHVFRLSFRDAVDAVPRQNGLDGAVASIDPRGTT